MSDVNSFALIDFNEIIILKEKYINSHKITKWIDSIDTELPLDINDVRDKLRKGDGFFNINVMAHDNNKQGVDENYPDDAIVIVNNSKKKIFCFVAGSSIDINPQKLITILLKKNKLKNYLVFVYNEK